MDSYKNILGVALLVFILGCDRGLEIKEDLPSPLIDHLTKEWQFRYLIVESDTFEHIYPMIEPNGDPERDTGIGLYGIDYTLDRSYQLILDPTLGSVGPLQLGFEENYQPHFGFWEISDDGTTLTHNQLMPYETQYELIELSEEMMVRRKIGGHVNYNDSADTFLERVEYIEVLLAK